MERRDFALADWEIIRLALANSREECNILYYNILSRHFNSIFERLSKSKFPTYSFFIASTKPVSISFAVAADRFGPAL